MPRSCRGRGAGLGLAVVYALVNTHKGIIDVESAHEMGAIFCLHFPVSQSATAAIISEEQYMPEVPGGTETILLVEDEELLLELVQSLLESKGYATLIARDGNVAVKLYKAHREQIDLVLTDLGLPGLNGWEACKQMKALDPTLKVVVATGYLDPTAKEEMMKGGIQEFVQKPYLAAELTTTIRTLLDANLKS